MHNRDKASVWNQILQLGARQARYREDGKWYHNLENFPGVLFDKNGYILFQTKEEYATNPQLIIQQRLHTKADGIRYIKGYKYFTPLEKLYIEQRQIEQQGQLVSTEELVRVKREIEMILRNKKIVAELKELYNNTCQICGIRLKIYLNKHYSEIHHIIPLGNPHNGADKKENMICVCPNCHVQLNLFAIKLEKNKLILKNHDIADMSFEYHNTQFYRNHL